MKEFRPCAGEHISRACERLVAMAPAFAVFNDVRVEAHSGETAGDVEVKYHKESKRRREEYKKDREAFEATPAGQRQLAEARAAEELERAAREDALRAIEDSGVRSKYPWGAGMGEISGFGGGYESACRDMLYAGLALVESGVELDAQALEKSVLAVCPDCSGAMYGSTTSAVRFVVANGWAKYVEAMTPTIGKGAQR